MRCAACGFESPGGFRFCGGCGQALAEPETRSAAVPRAYTPPHLAERILRTRSALEGEHKQVTVLFVDVKQSMELAEALGAEAWHRTLDQLFRLLSGAIHALEGTVNQYTGDGLMALFGAPIAHEDHAARACHAALRISSEVASFGERFRASHDLELGVRMGLNTGDVVVGRIGDDLRMDYTAHGHVVGLAARMEELAAAGQTLLTEPVARCVRGFFRLDPLGSRPVAGAREPVPVYALGAATAARSRIEREPARLSPLVGRRGALASLDKALGEVEGGNGIVLGIEGDPGVGKSRLCFEFAASCRAKGVSVLEVHCPSHAATMPRFALRELTRACFGLAPDDPAEGLSQELERRRRDDAESADLLADLLGVARDGRASPAGRGDGACVAAVAELVAARARRGLLLVLIDDLHWIDAASQGLVGALVDALDDAPLLLLVNFRPEHRAPWMARPRYRQLGLAPLDRRTGAELLDALLGEVPPELQRRLLDRAEGNPLFLEELARVAADAAGTDRPLEVPESVRALIAARLDRLSERDKRVAQLAAVVGRRFRGTVLEPVSGLGRDELAAALAALRNAEVIHRETLYGDSHVFKHPLTREVAYGSLLSERRREAHSAAALALMDLAERLGEQASLIAHHWDAAGHSRRAAEWRRRAALHVTHIVPRRTWRERGRGRDGLES